ncbi:carbon monoxide dehydrogenase subunit G [Nocardioides sp. CER19]|uniref:SRPBCC family protein n=1 Tax=Nocardioides sp. CER19 TaxID=3038538 RepID=UPI002449BBB6|nr:carbon monoxide dehydrogenase subunit G [Nocardioides sp. CER19]MDH2415180.1 carbon monoxide dehydrogenase subunit G [Nocardioides sp. CER19]
MKISGSVTVPHPVDAVWDAILDPAVLVRTIPGCSRLETVGENSYAMTVTAGVAAIKGAYDGTAVLSDLEPGKSLLMRLTGAGAPGTIDATVGVTFAEADGGTEVSYDADAIVGGMVGGVGQRMLTSVSKRMAGEFFTRVGDAIGGLETASPSDTAPSPVERAETRPAPGTVFTAPARQGDRDEFMKGIAVGAGLVLLGVVAGRLFGRGR